MKSPRRKRAAARAEVVAAASHGSALASILTYQRALLTRLRAAHAREPDATKKNRLGAEITLVETVIATHEADLTDVLAQAEAERTT